LRFHSSVFVESGLVNRRSYLRFTRSVADECFWYSLKDTVSTSR